MNSEKKLDLIHKIFYKHCVKNLWFEILNNETKKNYEVLEIGSGSGKGKQNTSYPNVKKIVGIDLDERVLHNPFLDEAYHANAYEIKDKIQFAKFDLIYSHMVAEHIDDGKQFLSTQIALLKEGGMLLHSTVSKYYWTSLINDFIPEICKKYLIKTLGSQRNDDDVFPTHYKLNSRSDLRKACKELSLHFEIIRQDEPPGYLRRSIILMVIYTIIHKPLQYIIPSLRPTFIFKAWRRN